MLLQIPKLRTILRFGSRSDVRNFATILSTGEKVERELSPVEREFINIKDSEFSKLGLYRKNVTNEFTLYKLFQMAQSGNKLDYAACVYAMNHFYNFGVELNHYDFTNRWLATAVETARIDEAVSIVKLWHTWLPHPPRVELVEVLIGMVKREQARELLASIRENWQMPLSSRSYVTVISKELAVDGSVSEAFVVWQDAIVMDVVLPISIQKRLAMKLSEEGQVEHSDKVRKILEQQCLGGIVD